MHRESIQSASTSHDVGQTPESRGFSKSSLRVSAVIPALNEAEKPPHAFAAPPAGQRATALLDGGPGFPTGGTVAAWTATTTVPSQRALDEAPSDRPAVPARPRVSAVIPALNEAENLPYVFARLPVGLHEVVLVDGHSTDGTVAVARALLPGIKVVSQDRRGKGNALICGFAACEGDIVVMLDADGSTDPAEIPRFVQALLDDADFAKGSRFTEGNNSDDITRIRLAGNRLLCGLVNRMFGTRYTDLCYGYNAFWSTCLESIDIDCDGFEIETLLNIRAHRAGLRVAEVSSHEYCRISGSSNLRTIRDGWRVLKTIFREKFRAPSARVPSGLRRVPLQTGTS